MSDKSDEKSFAAGKANHFVLNFPNGNRISSIWGWGSYTENYNVGDIGDVLKTMNEPMSSNDVEVMVDCSKELFKKLQRRYKTTNTVFGYININQWLKLVAEVAGERRANVQPKRTQAKPAPGRTGE